LGGEQVIAVRIERAVRNPISYREELARRIEEKTELHLVEHFLAGISKGLESCTERPRRAGRALESVNQNIDAHFKPVGRAILGQGLRAIRQTQYGGIAATRKIGQGRERVKDMRKL